MTIYSFDKKEYYQMPCTPDCEFDGFETLSEHDITEGCSSNLCPSCRVKPRFIEVQKLRRQIEDRIRKNKHEVIEVGRFLEMI